MFYLHRIIPNVIVHVLRNFCQCERQQNTESVCTAPRLFQCCPVARGKKSRDISRNIWNCLRYFNYLFIHLCYNFPRNR
jgi:hypothetical protein